MTAGFQFQVHGSAVLDRRYSAGPVLRCKIAQNRACQRGGLFLTSPLILRRATSPWSFWCIPKFVSLENLRLCQ